MSEELILILLLGRHSLVRRAGEMVIEVENLNFLQKEEPG